MKDVSVKTDGDSRYLLDDFNLGELLELKNAVTLSGAPLDKNDPAQLLRAIVDINFPIGCLIDYHSSIKPLSSKIPGVFWELVIAAQGRLIVGASTSGTFAVTAGQIAGESTSTDPTVLTADQNPPHQHVHGVAHYANPASPQTVTGSFGSTTLPSAPLRYSTLDTRSSSSKTSPNTNSIGGQPHSHPLDDIKRYGVKYWRRVLKPDSDQGNKNLIFYDGVFVQTVDGDFKFNNANLTSIDPVSASIKFKSVYVLNTDTLYFSDDEGLNYITTLNTPGSDLTSVLHVDDRVYVAGADGLRTSDAGVWVWEHNTSLLSINDLSYHANRLHAATSSETPLAYTIDEISWTASTVPVGVVSCSTVEYSPAADKLYAVAAESTSNFRLLESVDNGDTYTPVFNDNVSTTATDFFGLVHVYESGVMLYATSEGLYKAIGPTSPFTQILPNVCTGMDRTESKVFVATSIGLYVSDDEFETFKITPGVFSALSATDESFEGFIFFKNSNSVSLTRRDLKLVSTMLDGINVKASFSLCDTLFSIDDSNLYVSNDKGENFITAPNLVAAGLTDVFPLGREVYLGGAGGLFISTIDTWSWSNVTTILNITDLDFCAPNMLAATSDNSSLAYSNDFGATWLVATAPTGINGCSAISVTNGKVYATVKNTDSPIVGPRLLVSTDFGVTYNFVSNDNVVSGATDFFGKVFEFASGRIVYATSEGIYTSSAPETAFTLAVNTAANGVTMFKGRLLISCGTDGIYYTDDEGLTFNNFEGDCSAITSDENVYLTTGVDKNLIIDDANYRQYVTANAVFPTIDLTAEDGDTILQDDGELTDLTA